MKIADVVDAKGPGRHCLCAGDGRCQPVSWLCLVDQSNEIFCEQLGTTSGQQKLDGPQVSLSLRVLSRRLIADSVSVAHLAAQIGCTDAGCTARQAECPGYLAVVVNSRPYFFSIVHTSVSAAFRLKTGARGLLRGSSGDVNVVESVMPIRLMRGGADPVKSKK